MKPYDARQLKLDWDTSKPAGGRIAATGEVAGATQKAPKVVPTPGPSPIAPAATPVAPLAAAVTPSAGALLQLANLAREFDWGKFAERLERYAVRRLAGAEGSEAPDRPIAGEVSSVDAIIARLHDSPSASLVVACAVHLIIRTVVRHRIPSLERLAELAAILADPDKLGAAETALELACRSATTLTSRPAGLTERAWCLVRMLAVGRPKETCRRILGGATDPRRDLPARGRVGFLDQRKIDEYYAGWRERSGTTFTWTCLTQQEAVRVMPTMRKDAIEGSQPAFSALLAFFLQVPPRRFGNIAIGEKHEADAFLTPALGRFTWRLSRLRKAQEQPGPGDLPTVQEAGFALPREVEELLKDRSRGRPDAVTLAELVEVSDTTTSELERYLHGLSPASRPITIERLSSAFSRLLLTVCDVDVVAAGATADFTLVPRMHKSSTPRGGVRVSKRAFLNFSILAVNK